MQAGAMGVKAEGGPPGPEGLRSDRSAARSSRTRSSANSACAAAGWARPSAPPGLASGTAARQLLWVPAGDDHPVDCVPPAGMAAAGCSPGDWRGRPREHGDSVSIGAWAEGRLYARSVSGDASSAPSPSAGGGRSAVPDGTHHDPDEPPAPSRPVMTTIRRHRVSAPAAVKTDSTTPRTAGTPHRRPGDPDPVRLTLIDPPGHRTTLDGAWWPRTRSLSDELPGLVQELHRRGIRGTRAAYNPDAWETAPRRLAADGRTIRLGWFRSIDPQLLDLTGDTARGRLDLLVVPPDTTAATARQAFTAASDRANRRTPTAVLSALHPPAAPVPAPQPAVDRLAVDRLAVDRLAVGHAAPAEAEAETAG